MRKLPKLQQFLVLTVHVESKRREIWQSGAPLMGWCQRNLIRISIISNICLTFNNFRHECLHMFHFYMFCILHGHKRQINWSQKNFISVEGASVMQCITAASGPKNPFSLQYSALRGRLLRNLMGSYIWACLCNGRLHPHNKNHQHSFKKRIPILMAAWFLCVAFVSVACIPMSQSITFDTRDCFCSLS